MRVVVLGGLGNFGRRICARLSQEPGIEVIPAGRRARAQTAASDAYEMIDLDTPNFRFALQSLRPDLVIHCIGPFQGQDYRVARATLECGAHYLDLADGREFVSQFAAHNHAAALHADRAAITGASTLPALSSAVVDHLHGRFAQIETIDIAIAPGQHAPRGIATITGVLGYAGRAFPWWEDGRWRTAYGWQQLRRVRFPYGTRWAAACDVPDLVLLPNRYAEVRSVTFRAALEVSLQHYALCCIAGLRRLGVPVPAERWATALNHAAAWMDRFGTDCGGMRVSLSGTDAAGRKKYSTWNLVAGSNHGPEIPSMASVLLTRKLANGGTLESGASPCMGMLTLADFELEFARWDMQTSIEEDVV